MRKVFELPVHGSSAVRQACGIERLWGEMCGYLTEFQGDLRLWGGSVGGTGSGIDEAGAMNDCPGDPDLEHFFDDDRHFPDRFCDTT
jgi:hypothetical protein